GDAPSYLKELVVPYCPTREYMSKYRPIVVLENKSTKDAMRPAKVRIPLSAKPAVPVKTANPPMGIYTKRDFMRMATAVLMKPRPACVDTRSGHKQLLDNSGLVPEYIKKVFFLSASLHTKKKKAKYRIFSSSS
uniref:Uncharacterized protein n=1 Tax=Cyclopterus lumpus TaxID=8103 RepID=A0A8C3AU13_CYCLU